MAKQEKSSATRPAAGDPVFGRNLKFLRKHFGFTQEALADQVGITKGAVSQYEKGLNYPNFETLKAMGVKMGCGVDALLFGPTNRFRQTNLAGTTIDDRVQALPEAMREHVLEALQVAERAAQRVPGQFLRKPSGESWETFHALLTELAYGKGEAPK